ncbi:MAG: pyrimidine-nucleoside phosphorylase [Desulfotomaculaceae bacterium]
MRMYDLILKKREGQELTAVEIKYFISGYNCGEIPDYQAAALLMAIFFRGLNEGETAELTMAICDSGDRADLSGIPGIKVDKHSTGGVGDKTTLVLVPLVAAAGVPVAKMSGRGLGHTGGTVDKLESIPGFNVALLPAQFIEQVRRVGAAVVAQTGNLAPADKKLYALRDVTATVDSVPLIASSVMSKKIAAGADAIVLDVKVGSGAFMKDTAGAYKLARTMVGIGSQVGRRTVAVITDMDQPMGRAVGNALEVKEAIDTLKGEGPLDLLEICLVLGGIMLLLAGKSASLEEGKSELYKLLESGKALEKFEELISAQGGDPRVTSEGWRLPAANSVQNITTPLAGYVQAINAAEVGRSAMLLGAGREKKDARIDLSVGLVLNKKVGDPVQAGESLATIHANNLEQLEVVKETVLRVYTIGLMKPELKPLIIGTVPENI